MNFSEVLKSLMSRQGWNQEDLAKAGEVKQPTVSRYLSGRTIPTLTFIANLYKNEKIDPIIFVRDFEKEPIDFDSDHPYEERQNLVEEVTIFLRFLKSTPDALEIFWKLYKMDQSGRKSMNVLADRILEE
ncbi:helix-turn-helix domain-containing protein [Leptospira santarosai]|uniref:helix-turn-helix domain-containing protein n=1 Tax=Leptospira santarosai TaxID=28183 RepID=UPI0002BD41DC|nr:helix-turn-helix transcriptional regulator [Leptospira santarosai]EMO72034.1 DNA-binding helix-turn-helix protein [Leptospira santarosai str. 200403458]EMO99692.1 DNA-binding helix-turn-helix protein [Leptospira santarosai str. 200702252]MBW9231872.1 helix-turn-helix transcriptional regulator [Leptospira santarosai]MDI7212174.1 helix-turn-helix transcriptional regulator [Leptospira santarosai]MDI7237742.1 helix-turn-helix transcriptional regulator [Leptospira santarosai]